MPSKHIILCPPFFLLLPSVFPSIRVFSNESALCIRWPKYWSFSVNICLSNEHPGLISFRMDWLDLLAVQGTLKSLLLHHSSKASILWCSAFFIVQYNPFKGQKLAEHIYLQGTYDEIALTWNISIVATACNPEGWGQNFAGHSELITHAHILKRWCYHLQ